MKEEFQKLLDKTYRPETWNPAASELKEDTTRSVLMGIGRIGDFHAAAPGSHHGRDVWICMV